jgi:hypothetical protein
VDSDRNGRSEPPPLRVLQQFEQVTHNVSRTCRFLGVSRTLRYEWRRRYQRDGLPGPCQVLASACFPPRPISRPWCCACGRSGIIACRNCGFSSGATVRCPCPRNHPPDPARAPGAPRLAAAPSARPDETTGVSNPEAIRLAELRIPLTRSVLTIGLTQLPRNILLHCW